MCESETLRSVCVSQIKFSTVAASEDDSLSSSVPDRGSWQSCNQIGVTDSGDLWAPKRGSVHFAPLDSLIATPFHSCQVDKSCNPSTRRGIRLSLNDPNVSLCGLRRPHNINIVLIFKLPPAVVIETNVPKCSPPLYRAPESHERIKGACRREEQNADNANGKWPTDIVSHFILIAWIMELVSKANVSCFIAFHVPPCFIALS